MLNPTTYIWPLKPSKVGPDGFKKKLLIYSQYNFLINIVFPSCDKTTQYAPETILPFYFLVTDTATITI